MKTIEWKIPRISFPFPLLPYPLSHFPFLATDAFPSNFLLSNLRFVGHVINSRIRRRQRCVYAMFGGFFFCLSTVGTRFPFVPDFLHQSLICKLFLHSTQTICVFTVALPGCFSPFWVLPDKLCHIKSNMESTPKPRVDILRGMKRKCGCGNKRGVMCMS